MKANLGAHRDMAFAAPPLQVYRAELAEQLEGIGFLVRHLKADSCSWVHEERLSFRSRGDRRVFRVSLKVLVGQMLNSPDPAKYKEGLLCMDIELPSQAPLHSLREPLVLPFGQVRADRSPWAKMVETGIAQHWRQSAIVDKLDRYFCA